MASSVPSVQKRSRTTAEQLSRMIWGDLKSRTSIKVRDRKRKQAMTGNNPINEDPPTELEMRVNALVGSDYVQGHETFAESGPVEEELQLRMEHTHIAAINFI
ncbi:uncharacterized protein LOC118748162 isoform X3 [Rhagoletis pomonella]|uniref:uncharacterized protein LOC118748162 isoform X3 n=1 Tax=Rhagoletis pomonella TaxID=28610 RepID=UPI00177EBBE1|nr:uncharacterized protein LOC118748162 isoform X3 [Rhagoletis pomonella]